MFRQLRHNFQNLNDITNEEATSPQTSFVEILLCFCTIAAKFAEIIGIIIFVAHAKNEHKHLKFTPTIRFFRLTGSVRDVAKI